LSLSALPRQPLSPDVFGESLSSQIASFTPFSLTERSL
jgi:hypothetical protein